MRDATTTPDGEPSADGSADVLADPTLAALVPGRSPSRNVLLAAAAVVVLVLAWLSPNVLRVSLLKGLDWQGAWEALAGRGQVLAITSIDPQGWPSVTVQSIPDLPGARVAGAWVVPSDWPGDGRVPSLDHYADTVDYVRALFPKDDLDAGRLPVTLEPGSGGRLVILWEVTDCTSLDPDVLPEVDLRSALGTGIRERFESEFMGPAADLDTLAEYGICPAG